MGGMGRRSESFAEFVERKEAEAARAVLSPFVTEVDQPPADVISIGNAWTRRLFDGPFYVSASPSNEVPSTSLVFVRSRDGNTGAADPSSLGGGEADKHLIYEGLSRVAADAVMAGAETVRGGRTIARQLIDAGLIQDLYLTTSAKDGGEPGTPLYPRPLEGELVVRKRGTGPNEGVIFEYLRS
jgi:hypothetical protein